MTKILVLNGPNLNMLGTREPDIYGDLTLDDVNAACLEKGQALGQKITCEQSNHEGELVDLIQAARGSYDAIIINAGAYTHTSVAIHDALKTYENPIFEVHISNPVSREEFRHTSLISPLASGIIAGCGVDGYLFALEKLSNMLPKQS